MPENNLPPATVISEHPDDRSGKLKTIYSVSSWTIFWRNFLAGASRALGSILIYLVFFAITSYLTLQFVWPHVQPLFHGYTQFLQLFIGPTQNQSQQPTSNGANNAPRGTGFPSLNITSQQLEELSQDPQIQEIIQQMQSTPQPSPIVN